MNGDILPPSRPSTPAMPDQDQPGPTQPPAEPSLQLPTPVTDGTVVSPLEPQKSRPHRRLVWWLLGGAVGLIVALAAAAVLWYAQALQPIDATSDAQVRVSIRSGSTLGEIGALLHERQLIRSQLAFKIYARLSGARERLQAGAYSLSPSESTQEIVGHLASGRTDSVTITFYPGATLRDPTDTPESKKTDVTTVLLRAGYSQQEIDAALAKQYDHPIFEGKPAGTGLEGYIYGETYTFSSDASVEAVLTHTFDVFYQKIQEQNLIEPLRQRGLTLYQGVILASIVQREVSSSNTGIASNDQRQVAQVFYTRLSKNMPLGSDVTAYYGADQIGAARSVEVDTPYNTRKHTGLTPGPIAVPTIGALAAVANPAPGDYLYFLSGDDEVTYFARTDEEHQANIKNHCHVKCAIP